MGNALVTPRAGDDRVILRYVRHHDNKKYNHPPRPVGTPRPGHRRDPITGKRIRKHVQKRLKAEEAAVAEAEAKKGGINRVQDMPLDIMAEVARYVDSEDIFRLGATCNRFWQVLKSPAAELIWRNSRPERMPRCPLDLSEFEYTKLMFGRRCDTLGCKQSSNARKGPIRSDFMLRVRYCGPCFAKSVLTEDELLSMIPERLDMITIFTTGVLYYQKKWHPGSGLNGRVYPKAMAQRIIDEFPILNKKIAPPFEGYVIPCANRLVQTGEQMKIWFEAEKKKKRAAEQALRKKEALAKIVQARAKLVVVK